MSELLDVEVQVIHRMYSEIEEQILKAIEYLDKISYGLSNYRNS